MPPHTHTPIVFAHRGVHRGDSDENTLRAFRRALATRDGFECDVRWSRDGVPFVVHDATLRRTLGHRGHTARVRDVPARDLARWGVPTLERVLRLLRDEAPSGASRAVMDMKERPIETVAWIRAACRRLRLPVRRLLFLVWDDVAHRLPLTRIDVYRARETRFDDRGVWPGVACKYTGTPTNHGCIRRALAHGQRVNLYSPRAALHAEMLRAYGDSPQCTFTL